MKVTLRRGRERIPVSENLWDKVVRIYDPIKGQKRFRAKVDSALVGGYTGASKSNRALSEWNVSSGDADSDILDDLPMLRQRSSDLVRNAPIAASAINTSVTNVVGTGLKYQSRIDREYLSLSDDAADEWEAIAEREFNFWAKSKDSDAARCLDFYGQQGLAYRSQLERGDIFYLTPEIKRKNNPYKLALQAIEADRVSNEGWSEDTPILAGGVKVDKYNAPLEYHILDSHPGNKYDPAAKWVKVSAYGATTGRRNVIHLFDVIRPGQKRGVPYLAPVMEALKQLSRYTDAELMAAVISGMFTVFIESDGQGLDVLSDQAQANPDDLALGNGIIMDLDPGQKANIANPGRPNAAFDPFFQAIVRQIGAALGIPFELLIKHFTSSYSASKAAFVEAWKDFRTRRSSLARNFCDPVLGLWMDEAVAIGRISAPGYFTDTMTRNAYLRSIWVGPGKGSIKEGEETKAALLRVDGGLTTLAQESAEMDGGDFDTNHRQRVKENNKRVEGGLVKGIIPDEDSNDSDEDDDDKNDMEN